MQMNIYLHISPYTKYILTDLKTQKIRINLFLFYKKKYLELANIQFYVQQIF